jgi:hypothetical protein
MTCLPGLSGEKERVSGFTGVFPRCDRLMEKEDVSFQGLGREMIIGSWLRTSCGSTFASGD